MSDTQCSPCPLSDHCPLRASRPHGQTDTPEKDLRTLRLKKRDEATLTDLLRNNALIIRQGAIKLTNISGDVLALSAKGDVTGPEVHFSEAKEIIQAKALVPEIEVCLLPWTSFEKFLFERPTLGTSVFRQLATNNMMARTSFHWSKKSLRERALLILHQLRDRFGVRYGQFQMIDLPLTKIDIASMMSTVQESTVRILSELREDGLISSNGKRIVILDNDRLDQMVHEITNGRDSKITRSHPTPTN